MHNWSYSPLSRLGCLPRHSQYLVHTWCLKRPDLCEWNWYLSKFYPILVWICICRIMYQWKWNLKVQDIVYSKKPQTFSHFLGLKLFWTQNYFCTQNFHLDKHFFGTKFFLTKNFFWLKKFLDPNFFWPKNI